MKLVFWDGTGVCLFAKRLEAGEFRWPKLRTTQPSRTDSPLAHQEARFYRQRRRGKAAAETAFGWSETAIGGSAAV